MADICADLVKGEDQRRMKWKIKAKPEPRRRAKPAAPQAPAHAASRAPTRVDRDPLQQIAAQLLARRQEHGYRAIAVCGAGPGVGVSFLAANLAIAIAETGVSTLLIDANLHRPNIDKLLPPDGPTGGLLEVLRADGVAMPEITEDDILPNFSILYAGGAAADASELLGGDRFRQVVDLCSRTYEFTVLDTPPAGRYADARRISSLAGYSLIVARRGLTFVNDIETLAAELREDGVTVLGTVLNG